MNFDEACSRLNEYLMSSQGNMIEIPDGNKFGFVLHQKYTAEEVMEWEKNKNITLPLSYKLFLTSVGTSKLFINKYGFGFDFYPLEWLEKYAEDIFTGMINQYPELLPVAANIAHGTVIAFDMRAAAGEAKLGVFSPEEDPEKWLIENSDRMLFSDWVVRLVESGSIDNDI